LKATNSKNGPRPNSKSGPNTTVELFCGIGGFRIAAEAVGLKTIWANDIESKACQVYRDQFGSPLKEGDIHDFLDEIPPHDVLSGGFPCQPFSSAGKKLGIRDPRGTLFQAIVQVIERHQPKFFVLENVKRLLSMERGCHFATILTALANIGYRIEWRLLNAVHFGLAQNRQRIVIVGTLDRSYGEYSILAPALDFNALNDVQLDYLHDQKSWLPVERHGKRFPTWGFAENGRFIAIDLPEFSDAKPAATLADILQNDVHAQFDFTHTMQPRLAQNDEVCRFVDGVEILSNQAGGARMGYTVFGIRGVAPTLTAATSRHYERYKIGPCFRRLTNVEYARLQGFPDDHCSTVSVYDQYSLYGNAVPPPLVEWVFRRIHGDRAEIPMPSVSQLALVLNEIAK
jgi:DNA (cytosine-5)-methyltransferase 1